MAELYLIAALFLIYLGTLFVNNKLLVQKVWISAFIIAFALTALSVVLLKFSGEDVMLAANEFNWYYFLYWFSALSTALGIINLWIYRRALWHIYHTSEAKNDKNENTSL